MAMVKKMIRWRFTTSVRSILKRFTPPKALLLSALGFAAYYRYVSQPAELIYQDNEANRALIQRNPRLTRRYYPTPWLINTYLQIGFVELKRALSSQPEYQRVDRLSTPDGAATALYWLGDELPADTPILMVLHTITGTPESMSFFMRDLQRLTDFRVVLCERRGHGSSSLATARFNTMGDVDDVKQQVACIQNRFPDAPLYAAGVSAGTAVLVRYLGENLGSHPIKGAFLYCPGYDITTAFARSVPWISNIMAKKLIQHFVHSKPELFEDFASLKPLLASKDLHQFHLRLYEFAGYASSEAYYAHCNPVNFMSQLDIPLLILNSEDDPVCRPQNIYDQTATIKQLPNAVVAVTKRGSHCTHFAGLKPYSWSHRLAAEFFLSLNKN